MPSVLELGKCCLSVYGNSPFVDGWQREAIYSPAKTGFFAALFTRGVGDERRAVLALRGTGDPFHDLIDDVRLTRGRKPFQYWSARESLMHALDASRVNLDHFVVTGHSLGGGLAALVSAKHRKPVPVVTFNAPGMHRAALHSPFGTLGELFKRRELSGYRNNFGKVMHIRSEYDPVSIGTGPRIAGRTRSLPNEHCSGASRAICAHGMETMIRLLKAEPEFAEPIQWGG